MPLWTILYSVAFWPALALVCGFAIVRGDRPIRLTAAAFLTGMIAGQLALSRVTYANLEIGLATADLAMLVAFTCLSIRWGRWWLVGLSAIQALMVLGHLARLSNPLSRLAYAILTGGGAYLQLALLALALLPQRRSPGRRA